MTTNGSKSAISFNITLHVSNNKLSSKLLICNCILAPFIVMWWTTRDIVQDWILLALLVVPIVESTCATNRFTGFLYYCIWNQLKTGGSNTPKLGTIQETSTQSIRTTSEMKHTSSVNVDPQPHRTNPWRKIEVIVFSFEVLDWLSMFFH